MKCPLTLLGAFCFLKSPLGIFLCIVSTPPPTMPKNLIYENFWAGGVKQPLNPSRQSSMDEASSEAGWTVATDGS